MNKYKIFLIIFFTIGILFRLYKIESIPSGLNQDETAIGYNAYSILQTGKDEHAITYPLYFKSFNDYKLPLYIYLTITPIKLFGLTSFAVRFVSLLSGISALFLIYLVSRKLFDRSIGLIALFLLVINPWHMFFSRVALEVNLATTLILLGVYLFITSLDNKSNAYLLGSVFSFGLSIYAYNVTRLIAPVTLLFLLILYRQKIFRLPKSLLAKSSVLFILTMLPFLWTFIQGGDGFDNQASQLLIDGMSRAEMVEFRSYALSFPFGLSSLFFNRWILILWEYFKNIIGFFSADYYFISGDILGNSSVGNFGMFHLFEFVTLLTGFAFLIKKNTKETILILGWILIIIVIVSISQITPHPTRSYPLVIPMTIISAFGFSQIVIWISKKRNRIQMLLYFFGSSIILYSLIFYFTSYFYRFPIFYADRWRSQEKPLVQYLTSKTENYSSIIFDSKIDLAYTSLLFYSQYDPSRLHNDGVYVSSGQLIRLEKTGNYEFRSIDWENDLKRDQIIVSHPEYAPDDLEPVKVFYYPERPVVVYFDNQLGQYPTQDVAFALYAFPKE